jgi:uncharacterized protein involved in exopolysaccharide biosynthesis
MMLNFRAFTVAEYNNPVGAEVDPDFEDERTPSPFAIPNAVLRHRGLILTTVAVGIAVGLVVALLQVPVFEAQAKFVISASTLRGAGTMSDLGPVQQRDPFDYFTTVIASTTVLDHVLESRRPSGGTIREHLGLADGGADRASARLALAGADVRLESTRRVGGAFPVMMVRATWTDPRMAADLANAFLAALADYDKEIRSTAAEDRRKFVETQANNTNKDLKAAEEALRAFREQNRLVAGGGKTGVPPHLSIRSDQLLREVNLQAELYVALKRTLDQVRIAKLDDASALVVVEPAVPPTTRSGAARRTYVAAGAAFGLLAGLVLTGLLELRRHVDVTTPEAQEFVGHLQAIRRQVTSVTGGLRGSAPPSPSVEQPAPKHDA